MNRTKARLLALLGLVVIVTTYILTHLYSPPRSITRLDSNILQLIPAAGNKTQSDLRIVYAATGSYGSWNRLSFQGCPVSKCKLQSSGEFKYIEKADVVLFEYQPDIIYPPVPRETRQHQYWVLSTKEAPKTPYNTWQESVNGKFNLTVTHRRDSGIYEPYGKTAELPRTLNSRLSFNYSSAKTKGAYVYVSNCYSFKYDRIKAINYLKKYIDIDFFGYCVGNKPCPRMNYTCEKVLHSKYRFYLSFENSLCKDYITEKFWARLASDSYLLPVAIGGLSQQEYDDVAPPNSYIHAYNFTSLDHLGRYLKMLMTNDTAYNRYHEWRASYRVETSGSMYKETACKLCQLAHTETKIPAQNNLDSWYSPRTTCRSHSMLPASHFSIINEIRNRLYI